MVRQILTEGKCEYIYQNHQFLIYINTDNSSDIQLLFTGKKVNVIRRTTINNETEEADRNKSNNNQLTTGHRDAGGEKFKDDVMMEHNASTKKE